MRGKIENLAGLIRGVVSLIFDNYYKIEGFIKEQAH